MTLIETTEPRSKDAHLWARHPQDWYVEPEWCSERLFDVETFTGSVLDPACGMGRIVFSARAAGYTAAGTDVEERVANMVELSIIYRSPDMSFEFDFLSEFYPIYSVENIVSNPPFGIADKFVTRALGIVTHKVAMLLPTKWMNGAKRGAWLETTPLRRVWLLGPRPSMPPGPVIEAGIAPGNGTTDFAWFVWEHGYKGRPELRWLRRTA